MLALEGQGALPGPDGAPRWLVGGDQAGRARALAAARMLRGRGWTVEMEVLERPLDGMLEYARARGIACVAYSAGPDGGQVFAAPWFRPLAADAAVHRLCEAHMGAIAH